MVNIQKQQAMRNVLYALAPLMLVSVYLFGWRYLAVAAVATASALVVEYLMSRRYGLKMTESLFVSSALFSLSLPPGLPLWMVALGMAFGMLFGKMVFGGFGKNIFNPAITARAFVYISFGVPMTARFLPPATAGGAWLPAGFGVWLSPLDSISAATPIVARDASILQLLLGNTAGSFGETSAILILLGGAFIIWKKAAAWRIVAGSLGSFAILQSILWITGVKGAADPLSAILSGSFLFATCFMITDPVSSSQSTQTGKWLYGIFFGLVTVCIRVFASWPEGVTFAILLANMFGPLADYLLKQNKSKKKQPVVGKGGKA